MLNGRDVSKLSRDELAHVRNTTIGFVFQSFNLLPRTSALENVEVPLLYAAASCSAAERRQKAMAALSAVGLADRADHHPNQLSGGQQQRVAIARALMTEPPMLLADEPTGNLDTRTSIEVMEIFQQLRAIAGITVIVITHEHQIAEYGTRIIAFRDGRIVSDAPTRARLASRRSWNSCRRRSPRSRSDEPRDRFELATKTLRRNPLRSALTLVGITIGVGAVVTMVAVGNGARAAIEEQVARPA